MKRRNVHKRNVQKMYKKCLNDPDDQDAVVSNPEPFWSMKSSGP